MKYLLFLPLLTLLLSCQNQETRYTQQSPEIETVKALIEDYNDKDWDQWKTRYADTAKIFYNSLDGMSFKEGPIYHQENDVNYTSRGFEGDDQTYEQVVDDKGRTWVNYWGTWKGSLEANGQELSVPVHLTYHFVDGKITREYGYWDSAPLVLALQEVEANKQEEDKKTN